MPTNLNLEELNLGAYNNYFFPCNPFDPWREQLIHKQFDPSTTVVVDDDVHYVSRLLAEAFAEDEKRYQTPQSAFCVDHEGKVINICHLLCFRPLIRLHSQELVTVDKLRGKYVMICCFFVPELWDASTWEVALACREFYDKMPNVCEVVIVAKMRGPWSSDEAAFHHFLSGFHPSCLVVPFEEKDRIHFICDSVSNMSLPDLYLVAPSGEVLLHNDISSFSPCTLVPCYRGSTSPFPFISQPLDSEIYKPPSSLAHCLCSDYVMRMRKTKRRGRPAELSWQEVPISHFQSSYVMLYLYTGGDLLPLLEEVEKAYKGSDKHLEIVIVYLPFEISVDPQSFLKAFGAVLVERNLSWWLAPVNYTAYSTLSWFFDWDKLVVVGPNDQFVDPRGAEVLRIYGIDYYPFTFKRVVDVTVRQLKEITLKSLLPSSCKPYLKTGKVVLLYFDFPSCIDPAVYRAFFQFSEKPNMVVFPISLDSAQEVESHLKDRIGELRIEDYSDKTKWFYCDGDAGRNFFLRFFNREFPTIVAFGKDGRLRSVLAHSRLPSSHAGEASMFKGSLKKEASFLLDEYYSPSVLEYLIREHGDLALVIKAKQGRGSSIRRDEGCHQENEVEPIF